MIDEEGEIDLKGCARNKSTISQEIRDKDSEEERIEGDESACGLPLEGRPEAYICSGLDVFLTREPCIM